MNGWQDWVVVALLLLCAVWIGRHVSYFFRRMKKEGCPCCGCSDCCCASKQSPTEKKGKETECGCGDKKVKK